MGSVVVVIILVVLVAYITTVIRGRRGSVVAKRGTGIGADLGGLADAPRVRVRDIHSTGPDRAALVLEPLDRAGDGEPEVHFAIRLEREEFGYELLKRWQSDAEPIAMVLPPGGRLIRLRSAESLQHLTLRRLSEE